MQKKHSKRLVYLNAGGRHTRHCSPRFYDRGRSGDDHSSVSHPDLSALFRKVG